MILPNDNVEMTPLGLIHEKVYYNKPVGVLEAGAVMSLNSQEDADNFAVGLNEALQRKENEETDG